MAYENLCMYCFEDNEGKSVCPHCGRDASAAVPAIQLLPGTLLYNNRFLVGRARGQDANGIVYMALDTRKNVPLRVREYLPRESARRASDGSVVPISGAEDVFDLGLDRLRASVENADDPRKRHFFFQENGTGYIAERKGGASAASTSAAAPEEAVDEGRNTRHIILIVAIAAVVVLGVALAIISMLNRAVDTPVTPVTTLSADSVWLPDATPSPTPYVGTTIGAIRDPELSWMEYVFPGSTSTEIDVVNNDTQVRRTATPRPTTPPAQATLPPEATPAPTIGVNRNSSREEITRLQNVLADTGWLQRSQVTGQYDNATRNAVSAFQQYMNDTYAIDPKLAVDGIAGPKTLYWLYQYNLSTRPTPTPAPTPTPTAPPRITSKPEENQVKVDENSPAASIRYVQQQLIELGMLPQGSDNGVYGSETRSAVALFQNTINGLQGRTVLQETGTADADTLAYLSFYVDWWQKNRPTETPTQAPPPTEAPTLAPAPTEAPTEAPTPTPTDPPEESHIVVDANSPTESIRQVQTMLATLGLMDPSSVDGVFGGSTTDALRAFQARVNELRESNVLQVTGQCDELTIQYLEYYYETVLSNMTPAPTEAPTEAPTPTPTETPPESQIAVDANSPTESIQQVQTMLATLGVLDSSSVDGVFGGGTTDALRAFQARVNELMGSDVLPVTGQCDATTLQYLETYYEEMLARATPVPQEPTEAPIEEPTPAPQTVDVHEAQDRLSALGFMDAGSATGEDNAATRAATAAFQRYVNAVYGENVLSTSGELDEDTLSYLENAGSIGQYSGVTPNSSSESIRALQQRLIDTGWLSGTADGVYGSGTAEALRNFQQHVNQVVGSDAVGITGLADAYTQSFLYMDNENVYNPNIPLAEPTPEIGSVETPFVSVDYAARTENGVSYIREDTSVSWSAQGDVKSYLVNVVTDTGETIVSQEVERNSMNLPLANLEPGRVYTVNVGAIPHGGTEANAAWSSVSLALDPDLTPTAEPTPEITVPPQVGNVGDPRIGLTDVLGEQGGVQYVTDALTISWGADGDVDRYYVYIADNSGNEYVSTETNDTSLSLPAGQLQPGRVYTVRIGVMPINGTNADAKWSTTQFALASSPDPTPEPTPIVIDQHSSSTWISKMQDVLYAGGWLSSDATKGELDYATRLAVAQFQQYMNETYASDPNYPGLSVIDPNNSSATIDSNTLRMIMNGYSPESYSDDPDEEFEYEMGD